MALTTLCYLEQGDSYLMLHRVKKEQDINKDKWIGIGGHFEAGESPEECLLREAKEETGFTLTEYCFRGIVTFSSDGGETEYMHIFTAIAWEGSPCVCDEGDLQWVKKSALIHMNLWEGDYIFLRLLEEQKEFFSLKLSYEKNVLIEAVLNGKPLELLDMCDENGTLLGWTRERTIAHRYGSWHRTAHVWLIRRDEKGKAQVLLQKRSPGKDSFPGCYDISSAGHIPAGMDEKVSAIRELQEELGVEAKEEELVLVGYHKGQISSEFYGKPFINREYSAVFVMETTREESDFILQEEEVSEVQYMDFEECYMAVRDGKIPNCIFLDELDMLREQVTLV